MLLKNNMENPFKKIAIIGLGLIGGSIGLAVKRFSNEIHLQGFAKSDLTVKTASLLLIKISLHIMGSEAAILVKSLNPPAEYLTTSFLLTLAKSFAGPTIL